MSGAAARARLVEVLEPAVTKAGFDLEDVVVKRAGAHSLLRVVVDRDGGVDLDAVAEVSHVVGEVLDANGEVMPGPYVLEVTSPGVDRPLTAPRHWRRAVGRLVRVVPGQGGVLTGRVLAADEDGVSLAVAGATHRLGYADVRRAVVQVDFSGPSGTVQEEDNEAETTEGGVADGEGGP